MFIGILGNFFIQILHLSSGKNFINRKCNFDWTFVYCNKFALTASIDHLLAKHYLNTVSV